MLILSQIMWTSQVFNHPCVQYENVHQNQNDHERSIISLPVMGFFSTWWRSGALKAPWSISSTANRLIYYSKIWFGATSGGDAEEQIWHIFRKTEDKEPKMTEIQTVRKLM